MDGATGWISNDLLNIGFSAQLQLVDGTHVPIGQQRILQLTATSSFSLLSRARPNELSLSSVPPRPLAARQPASALSRPIRCRGSNEGGTASCMQWQQERRRKLGCQGPGWRRAKQRVQRTAAAAAGLERMNARDLGATRTTVS